VRTVTHKLICFDGKDQWECYDLVKDPAELHNIYSQPEAQPVVAELKQELKRLQIELKDTENLYADPSTWPKESSYRRTPSMGKK
jgi:hypothetical protein